MQCRSCFIDAYINIKQLNLTTEPQNAKTHFKLKYIFFNIYYLVFVN